MSGLKSEEDRVSSTHGKYKTFVLVLPLLLRWLRYRGSKAKSPRTNRGHNITYKASEKTIDITKFPLRIFQRLGQLMRSAGNAGKNVITLIGPFILTSLLIAL